MRFSLTLFWLPLSIAFHLPEAFDKRVYSTKTPINKFSAESIISLLDMQPSDEGGYFYETFKDPDVIPNTNRSISTAIYYLLEGSAGQSLWHKLDAAEVWHYYAGAPLVLSVSYNNGSCGRDYVMGADLFEGQRPQAIVARGEWQSAKSLGEWTLVGTTGKSLPQRNVRIPSSKLKCHSRASVRSQYTDYQAKRLEAKIMPKG
jgi:predicted cupin superfamily sugar epimerase